MDARHRLRQQFFATLYSRLAPHYDRLSLAGFAGEWARWAAVAQRFVDRRPVLELGCGTGMTLAALARAGVPAWGVDPSGPMLAQARRRVPGRLVRARAQQLPVRSGSIGCVLSIFPTPYILDPATWTEVARVLQPGGRFIVVDHGWLQPRDPLRLCLVGLHHLVYGCQTTAPPRLPTPGLPAVALTERTPHGFVSVYVATRDE